MTRGARQCAWGYAAVFGLILSLAFTGTARAAVGDEESANTGPPQRLLIGLDLSKSNPLVDSQSYAASVADYVAGEIKDLPLASVVMIRTFGSYEGDKNNLRIDREISSLPDEKPAAVAALVQEIIAGVPQMVSKGTLSSQNRTNIVAFLEDMADFVDCAKMDTSVILVSDGIEDSEYARLKDPGDELPNPSPGLYAGCSELEIVGLGQGADSPSLTERLHDQWEGWAKAAGFKDFEGFNSW